MLRIKFRYADQYSNWKWVEQECLVASMKEFKELYGLDTDDCEYEVISVQDLGRKGR